VARRLLDDDYAVYGIDNLNDYYDVGLKRDRLAQLTAYDGFTFEHLDLFDREGMLRLFRDHRFQYVVHLAAQAGVRYSLENPFAYSDSNLSGFLNLLEGCRWMGVEHLVFASSSSVYGANRKVPFSVNDRVDHPVSLYAATKKANELMAHAYSSLYKIPTTGIRFFTVYGPWGRPDMAYFTFVGAVLGDRPIHVYNQGHMKRDFTYIDDVVEGVVRVLYHPPEASLNCDSNSQAPYKIYNIGNHQPVELLRFIQVIETALGKTAQITLVPMQPGDVTETYADVSDLIADVGFAPSTPIEEGMQKFVSWYRQYYSV
jgi:UDP-glucuronate 4-epimerase